MKKIILSIFGLSLLVSCSTTSHTYRSSSISDQNILSGQVVVDTKLDVKNRITSTSSKRNSAGQAMDEAYFKAIEANSIDVVVDPIFEVTTTDKILFWGGKSTAKMIGYGSKYENPRSKIEALKELKSVDTSEINKFDLIYNSSKTNNRNINSSSTKKSGLLGLGFLFL